MKLKYKVTGTAKEEWKSKMYIKKKLEYKTQGI